MNVDYGTYVARRRAIVGLSQRDLARSVGVTQPLVAAVETGAKPASQALRTALKHALAVRPSAALDARRSEVRAMFARAGLPEPRVFGSVARGSDDIDSDLDLVVEFTDQHDIVDLLAIEEELSNLLTVPVEIVDARAAGSVADRARAEQVAL